MAGTAAVFVIGNMGHASPVERDGMVWTGEELHLDSIPAHGVVKADMANALALEGLEEYDAPVHGDQRRVNSLDALFVYLAPIRGWVQIS
mgnify:CR=1 FL=1